MRLRPIGEADLEVVRRLRNSNRKWFFDTREVTVETQRRWFKALDTRPVDFYVLEVEGTVVGTASVTTSGNGLEIGNLILDPAWRGRGLMRHAVAELTAAPGCYLARVKPGNTASERVFLANGFTASPERSETVFQKIVPEG